MKKFKLTRYEKKIEDDLLAGKYKPVTSGPEYDMITRSLASFRKDAILHMRINQNDLILLKRKAKKRGIKYQTFVAEYLHQLAHS